MSSGEWFRLLYLLLYGCFADVVVVVDVVRSGEACSFLHRISFVLQVGERSRKVSLVVRRDDGAGRCCEVDDHVAFAADRVAVLVRQGHVALVDPLSSFQCDCLSCLDEHWPLLRYPADSWFAHVSFECDRVQCEFERSDDVHPEDGCGRVRAYEERCTYGFPRWRVQRNSDDSCRSNRCVVGSRQPKAFIVYFCARDVAASQQREVLPCEDGCLRPRVVQQLDVGPLPVLCCAEGDECPVRDQRTLRHKGVLSGPSVQCAWFVEYERFLSVVASVGRHGCE